MRIALEDRHNPSGWQGLLDLALPALDEALARHPGNLPSGVPAWTLGGGTALALVIGHRISDDVDLFVPWLPLREFTPARNGSAALISTRYQWPGSYLKFERPDGEIDFLSPQLQTQPGYDWETYKGRRIALERPEEVIVKKVRYRGSRFTERDVFDLAAVARTDGNLAGTLAEEVPDMLARLQAILDARSRAGMDIGGSIRPMPGFERLAETALDDARQVVGDAIALANDGPP